MPAQTPLDRPDQSRVLLSHIAYVSSSLAIEDQTPRFPAPSYMEITHNSEMQNPSIANSDIADKSAQFLEKLIFKKDYNEFKEAKKIIIVNQFAYVQTNDFDGSERYIGEENDNHIRQAVNAADIVLIAWGVSNGYEERKQDINSIINEFSNKVLLQTKAHPSRGRYVDFIEPYSI